MSDLENYTALQQTSPGNNNPGTATGTNYASLQSAGTNPQSAHGSGSGAAQATTKTYTLPDAETNWSSNLARFPVVSKLPLYKKAAPNYNQIQQQLIANCYLAATLACMANTTVGRAVIKKMINQTNSAITTICKKFDNGNPPGPEMQLKSDRWFTVSFKSQAVYVSDVLYHDDSDRDPNLRYLTTPNGDKALWGAIIEVAYARFKGSYDNISAGKGLTLDVFYSEFCTLDWDILHPDKDKTAIKKAFTTAGKKPTLIATNIDAKKLTHWHGYAVLSMSGTKVKLWDPLAAKEVPIEFNDLLTEIQAAVTSK